MDTENSRAPVRRRKVSMIHRDVLTVDRISNAWRGDVNDTDKAGGAVVRSPRRDDWIHVLVEIGATAVETYGRSAFINANLAASPGDFPSS
jgi:hypothetical protein